MGRVYWLTQRSLDDLCSTTIEYLLDGLASLNFDVVAIGPAPEIQERSWEHIVVNRSNIRGLRTSSLAKNIAQKLREKEINPQDIILIDWPLVPKVRNIIQSSRCHWIMIDRSPPADSGLLGKLQWRGWKIAWKEVQKSENAKGCVVSNTHAELVSNIFGIALSEITVLPARVDLELFANFSNLGAERDLLSLIYHGRIDKNRGIDSLLMIHNRLIEKGVKSKLTIIGDGDHFRALKAITSKDSDISIKTSVSRNEVGKLLSNSDVGFLPMQDRSIWNISSPLKLSEYLASGMVVCGINHSGHQIDDSGDWLQLFEEFEFVEKSADWLANLSQKSLNQYQNDARKYAEDYLGWSHSVDALGDLIKSCTKV